MDKNKNYLRFSCLYKLTPSLLKRLPYSRYRQQAFAVRLYGRFKYAAGPQRCIS
jgi:hypothetical protein